MPPRPPPGLWKPGKYYPVCYQSCLPQSPSQRCGSYRHSSRHRRRMRCTHSDWVHIPLLPRWRACCWRQACVGTRPAHVVSAPAKFWQALRPTFQTLASGKSRTVEIGTSSSRRSACSCMALPPGPRFPGTLQSCGRGFLECPWG